MGHTLLNILQKVFAGKTSAQAKLLMILCSNIFISPIQQSVYSEFGSSGFRIRTCWTDLRPPSVRRD